MSKPNFLILALALALAACTPKQQTVQEETPATAAAPTAAPAPAATVPAPVAAPIVSDPLIALQDPRSPLANRVVYFDFDRSEIKQEHLAQLEAHARFLVLNPTVKARLEGHCDERGTREYNIGLGDRRAQAVRRLMMFQGVQASQLVTVSYGEERPAADGHDEGAWAQNRRVELVYSN
jgi:peptidoglycan-associated lipoprotein